MSTVFLRANGVWCVKVKSSDGAWVQRTCETRDKATARSMGRMIDELGHRGKQVQDLLDAVVMQRLSVRQLYAAYAGNQLDELRAQLRDIDIAPLVQEWLDSMKGRLSADTIAHYSVHVRTLIEDGKRFPTSELTFARLAAWLPSIQRSRGTQRKYHAAMSSFCQYLKLRDVIRHNPMRDVKAPAPASPRRRHLEHDDVLRIVESLQEPYRSIVALMHGSGIEISAVLRLKRSDVDFTRREVHARGTKTVSRDRLVMVEPWAMEHLRARSQSLLPSAPLYPGVNRWTVSDKHRAACGALGIEGYQLRDSRHTYAVRAIRSGASFEVVAQQLGHADTSMAVRVYGRFKPSVEELSSWHQVAEARDRKEAAR